MTATSMPSVADWRNTVEMIFGDVLVAASTISPAAWIGPACVGAPGTVGALVPNRNATVLRIDAPAPSSDRCGPDRLGTRTADQPLVIEL